MPPKPSVVPRKRPKQERSQATVQAILGATAHILIEDGYDK
ncbi:MAG: TetR/AcrR family transcriptional regulator, partial [Oscillatoriales cyanobacterium]